MRWPWRRRIERRGFSDAILQAYETAATTKAASAAASAAVESVGGLLARTLSCASVDGPAWVRDTITPVWLGMVGRELVRNGEHLALVDMDGDGRVTLTPSGHWYWTGPARPESAWTATVSLYGPSDTHQREAARDELVFVQWSRLATTPHLGRSAHRLAHLAAKAAAEVERSLGDEAGGPITQIIPVPDNVGGEDKALTGIRTNIANARGRALLLESTAGGWGDSGGRPQRDWKAERLGPQPPEAMVRLAEGTFSRLVAASGASVALFDDSDGTSQRESLRRFHLFTVLPVLKMVERELRDRLEVDVRLRVDHYGADLAGRATAFAKLVKGGMPIEQAAGASGVLLDE